MAEEEKVEKAKHSIKDSLQRLDEICSFLRTKLSDIDHTIEGVKGSTSSAKREAEEKFQQLKDEINSALDERYDILMSTVNEVEQKDLEPLQEMREKITQDLDNVENMAREGQTFLDQDDSSILSDVDSIREKLKAVPPKDGYGDIPTVSQTLVISFDDEKWLSVMENVAHLGEVNMMCSLQIVELLEQPGGILVHWDELYSDSESFTDLSTGVQEFMLQCCRTDNKGNKESLFSTVYQGEDMNYLVTELETHVSYTFRVCGRMGSEGKWGPWSIPRNGITTLEPHEWSEDFCANECDLAVYQLTNGNRTATKVFPDSSKVLPSRGLSYVLGNNLSFKIDETGDWSGKDGIGLTASSFDFTGNRDALQCQGAASVSSKGVVFVNGQGMTTRLPTFKRGTVITFEVNKLSQGKLRVSIVVDEKQVTFDWSVDTNDDKLFFAMGFQQSGWQVTIL